MTTLPAFHPPPTTNHQPLSSTNLRRLIARAGLTVEQVARACHVNLRTVKAILAGTHQPQARTLHRLAQGLGASVDELFQDPSLLLHRTFDRRTNPIVAQVVEENPKLFAGWTEGQYDELYSRFGTGGALTPSGVVVAATSMNAQRQVHQKLALLLETDQADLVTAMIDVVYQKVVVTPDSPATIVTRSVSEAAMQTSQLTLAARHVGSGERWA